MATVVRMPAVMAGATEAALQSWLVAVGDVVEAGQTIAEIETEKAVFEQESEAAGTVAGLLVEPGRSVAVGTPIAVLAEAGESAEQALAAAGGAAVETATPTTATPTTESAEAARAEEGRADTRLPAPAGERLFASPLVRRLARERGIELAQVRGSGPRGRIVRRDLDALAVDAGTTPADAPPHTAPSPAEWTDEPHTPMRRAIARRLTESTSSVPHYYLSAECRADALLAMRQSINDGRAQPVTLTDLVVKAVAAAFTAVPAANAIWTDAAIRRFSGVDVAVAVAVDGGLVTPVVRGADRLPLGELSATLRDLIERARAGRLHQRELEGGSFSVSNLGMYGTREFAAVINPPHAGILAVGAAEQRAVVTDGRLEAATVMTVTLSADHRVLDGALAAQWLAAFVSLIESPARMLV
jgi:pyruvate dehydrogenase E2 component (dihydrolipoamide acetyltransferase)